jgi:hypothetical protein
MTEIQGVGKTQVSGIGAVATSYFAIDRWLVRRAGSVLSCPVAVLKLAEAKNEKLSTL